MRIHPTPACCIAGTIIFFISCLPGRITLNVLEPGRITIPAEITKVSLFPGAGIPDPPGRIDSLDNIEPDPGVNYNRIKRAYMEGIYDAMSASPRFLKVVPADTTYEILLESGHVSWNELSRICRRDSTNAVLILKKAVSRDSMVRYNYPGLACGIVYRLVNHTKWAFYQPFQEIVNPDIIFSDTSVFEEEDPDCSPHFQLSDINGILSEAYYVSGTKVAEEIGPFWKNNTGRIFFTGPGARLRQASLFVYDNKWFEAAEIWNDVAESRNRKLASRASFNLALAWEQDDDLEQASLWIAHADSLLSTGRTLTYKKILETRLKKKELLDQQLNGF